jgi:4-hydroxy-tetrahydrodipicolinate synthase
MAIPVLLRGAGTAIVTPFLANGDIDEASLRAFVSWQIEQGIDFIVPCGSTGEAMTMSLDEQRRVVEITVAETAGRVPVLAGAGSNDTKRAIEQSKMMKAAGATHLLHTSPMYNKPPQRGIIAHFRAIADAVDLPIVLYNVPSRTGSNMEAETTLALAEHKNIVAMKEASANIPQVAEICRHRPHGFAVFSGDDALTIAIMVHGGDGVISVTSNIAPNLVTRLCAAFHRGDIADARGLDDRLTPLTSAAFIESNPIPAKAALAMMGKMQNVVRSPLVPLAKSHTETLHRALLAVGALSA